MPERGQPIRRIFQRTAARLHLGRLAPAPRSPAHRAREQRFENVDEPRTQLASAREKPTPMTRTASLAVFALLTLLSVTPLVQAQTATAPNPAAAARLAKLKARQDAIIAAAKAKAA